MTAHAVVDDIVNLERYPITNLVSDEGAAFVQACRNEFLERGLCELPEFVRPDALARFAEEGNAVLHHAWFYDATHNAYLTDEDPALPDGDVSQRQEQTFVGSVAYDRLGNPSLLRDLYLSDALRDFIGSVLGKSAFYRLADPLGSCSINVFVDGGQHGWHFDEAEFAVTLMLQHPQFGGEFEYVSAIRGAEGEKHLLEQILDGDRRQVEQLEFTPGTLLIFAGHQTLHRVTRVEGPVPRLVPVLCYSDRPDQVNSEKVRKMFWGR